MAKFLTPVITDYDGEKVFAELLKEKLGNDYLCWHDVSIKSHKKKRERCPDFIVFNPKYGFWILEVKDWSLSYILGHNPKEFTLADRKAENPHEQARRQALALKDLLKREAKLTKNGRFLVPIVWGTVFYNITRQEFEFPERTRSFATPGKLGNIHSQLVICSDELKRDQAAKTFEQRLLSMFDAHGIPQEQISENLIPIIRNLIFPDIQVVIETTVHQLDKPSELKLFDFDQEEIFHQLSVDSGAHVLFGVAGSGKTIVLLNKARELLEQENTTPPSVLYLCRGTCVAQQIQRQATKIGLPKDTVFSYHKWCSSVLRANNISIPPSQAKNSPSKLMEEFKKGNIRTQKYDAILVDEGHDFKDKLDWLALVASMRKSEKSLFVLAYDDAQALYDKDKKNSFSLNFLGDPRTIKKHILRKNYRNTEQILLLAKILADAYLKDSEHENIPKVRPIGHGARGKLPILLEHSSLEAELATIAAEIKSAHKRGKNWSDIAVLFHTHNFNKLNHFAAKIEGAFNQNGIPCSQQESDFAKDLVKIISIKKAKGLGFSMVCLVGASRTEYDQPDRDSDETNKKAYLDEDIRYLYNAFTRALDEIIITYTKPKEGTLSYRKINKLITALDKVRASEPQF